MDNFKEDIVTSRSTLLHNVLYALCWVMIVVSGIYAFLLLQVLMVAFTVPTLLVTLVQTVTGVAICKFLTVRNKYHA